MPSRLPISIFLHLLCISLALFCAPFAQGAALAACKPKASLSGGKVSLTFTATGTCAWTVPDGVTSVEYLLVGGGGGGGGLGGGGGGGGGVIANLGADAVSVRPGSVESVSIGAGGTGGAWGLKPTAGSQSKFLGQTAGGGGFGGDYQSSFRGGAGSSGGGSGTAIAGGATTGQGLGKVGGTGSNNKWADWFAGGGGGAISAGGSPHGGSGYTFDGKCYAGGGGGGTGRNVTPGTASCGGGTGGQGAPKAQGFYANPTVIATAGTPNSGGGGGGGGGGNVSDGNGAAGGSGILIVRYDASLLPCTEGLHYQSVTVGTDTVLTFNSTLSCPWTVPNGVTSVKYLLVGGGGGGGGGGGQQSAEGIRGGGGGGAGGLLTATMDVTAGTSYEIQVGAGGMGGIQGKVPAAKGGATKALGLTANGGGAGGNYGSGGADGGSGGGSGSDTSQGGAGTEDQGNIGGPATAAGGGGGGGAGNASTGLTGGSGLSQSITGSALAYATGGSGGAGSTSAPIVGTNGRGNGGGGGGGDSSGGQAGAAGGSGVVVLRYTTPPPSKLCAPQVSTDGTDTVLKFTSTTACAWTVPAGVTSLQYLVVGGGGGGGGNGAGGGGGGGFLDGSRSVTPGAILPVVVGVGGTGTGDRGGAGGSSSLAEVVAAGGGGGGHGSTAYGVQAGGAGGSGGGGGYNAAGGAGDTPSASPAQGYSGGAGAANKGGGGGGAGGVGSAAPAGYQSKAGGAGGSGRSSSITGIAVSYGGGGGGGSNTDQGSPGGAGGGGNGSISGVIGFAGVAYTGGGGGGGGLNSGGGAGGSGVVIVRYATPPITMPCALTTHFVSTTDGANTVLAFKDPNKPCLWTVPAGVSSVQYLVVAGGGGGGKGSGGGGGAGGVLGGTLTSLPEDRVLPVAVGWGGSGARLSAATGGQGGDSLLGSDLRAIGGGGGGGWAKDGGIGGSGGGGGGSESSEGARAGGVGLQGFNGGTRSGKGYSGAGGGGSGAVGEGGTTTTGGAGGAGSTSSITGSSVTYAGGGGGGVGFGAVTGGGAGGSGGGGNGGVGVSGATAGTPNTGGGGGGGGSDGSTDGGDGGSGVVIVRYVTPTLASLRVKTAPVGDVAGEELAIQPQIELLNAQGNVINTDEKDSTLVSVYANNGGVLGCTDGTQDCLTQQAVNGVVTFEGITLGNVAGTEYELLFTDGSLSVTAPATTVTPAAASKLVFTAEPPASVVQNVPFAEQPVVTIQDQFGNTVTDATEEVSLVLNTGTLTGTTSVNAEGGVATFADVGAATVGSNMIITATTSLAEVTPAVSTSFDVTSGASQIAFTAQPSSSTVAGVAFATQPVVTIQDASGNPITSGPDAMREVTLAISSGTGTLVGEVRAMAFDGVAEFNGLKMEVAGAGKVMTASAALAVGARTAASNVFDITHAAASKLAFTTQPSESTAAGAPFANQPVVTIQDAFGNTVTTGADATRTVSLTASPGSLGGTTSKTADAGVATFTGLSMTDVGTGNEITASATLTAGARSVASNEFAITAAATKLAITSPAATATAGSCNTLLVKTQDAQGNAAQPASTVTLTPTSTSSTTRFYSDSSCSTPLNPATIPTITTSTSIATLHWQDTVAGTPTLTVAASGGVTGSDNQLQTVQAATASQLVISTLGDQVAGPAFPVTVTLADTYGNAVSNTGGSSTITLTRKTGTGSLGGTVSGTLTVGQSVVTINGVTYTKAESGVSLTATGSGGLANDKTGDSNTFDVTAGAASKLVFTSQPGGGTAGATWGAQPVVAVQDANGNTVTTSASTITLAITANTGTTGATLNCTSNALASTSGVASFAGCAINKAGNGYTLTASDGVLPSSTSTIFNISAGAATKLAITSTAVTASADTCNTLTVETQDAQDNAAQPGSTVTLTPSSTSTETAFYSDSSCSTPLTIPASIASSTSSATLYWQDTVAGTPTLTVTASGGVTNAPTQDQTVQAGAPSNGGSGTEIFASPTSVVADNSTTSTLTATLRDQYGNTATDTVGHTIRFTSPLNGSSLSSSSCTITAGASTCTVTVKSTKAGTDAITATDTPTGGRATALSNISGAVVTFTADTPSQLVISMQPVGGTSGSALTVQPVIAIQDAQGNTVITDDSTPVTVAIQSGTVGTNYVLRFSGGGLPTVDSSNVTVTPGTATQIALNAGNNQSATAGSAVATVPSVIVKDANGNPVAGVSVTFAVATGGGTVAPTTAVTTGSDGIAAVTSWTLGTTAGSNTLTATSGSLTGSPVTLTATGTAGAASQLVISMQPVGGTSGSALTVQPVIAIQDAQGNTVITDDGTPVTVAIQSGTGGTLGGTKTVTAVDGVASFTDLTLTGTVGTNYVLRFSTTGLSALDANPIRVAATQPSAPGVPVATAGNRQVSLNWTAPTEQGGTPILGYTVNGTPSGSCTTQGDTRCVITGLTNGTSYTFTVVARNAQGDGPASAASAPVTPLSVVAPMLFSVSPSSGSQNGGTTVTLIGSDLAGATAVTFGGHPAQSVQVVSENEITAKTPAHAGGVVDVSVTTPTGQASLPNGFVYDAPPAQPGAPIVAPGDRRATVSWVQVLTSGGTPASYTVIASPGGQSCNIGFPGLAFPYASCVVTGLTNGTAYTFKVTATNAEGSKTSPPSAPATPLAVIKGTCDAANGMPTLVEPKGLLCATGEAGPVINTAGVFGWSCQGQNGGSSQQCSAPGISSPSDQATPSAVTLTSDSEDSGCELQSARLSAPPLQGPGNGVIMPYGAVNFEKVNCNTPPSGAAQVLVRLTYADVVEGMQFWKYVVNSQGFTGWRQMPANQVTIIGKTVEFTVVDNGEWDNDPAVGAIADPGGPGYDPNALQPPGQPINVTATAGDRSATIRWEAPKSGGQPVNYIVAALINGVPTGQTCVATWPATSCIIQGLINGQAYTFIATAENAAGAGTAGVVINPVTPKPNPVPPPNPIPTLDEGGLFALASLMAALGGWQRRARRPSRGS